MDLSILSLIISGLTALGGVIATLKIKSCHSGCFDSECFKTTPNTPIEKTPLIT